MESSSLAHFPTTIVALNRTVRDGKSHASGLTSFAEEWLVERDWYIASHWEGNSVGTSTEICATFMRCNIFVVLQP